jgi:DNA-binding CsgD family transcriptional regulator
VRKEDEAEGLALLADALTTRGDGRAARTLLLRALCRLSGAEGANLLLGHHYLSPGPDIRSEANHGVRQSKSRWIMEAQSRFAPKNPILSLLPRIEGPVYVPMEVLGTRSWRDSEYVVDYLEPIDTTGSAGMILRRCDGTIFGGVLLGHVDPKGFSRRGLSMLARVARSVERGLSDIEEWEAWQRSAPGALDPVLGAMNDPVVLIERAAGTARLVSASPAAARILSLLRRGERHNPELSTLLAASLAASSPGDRPVVWKARDSTPYELKVGAIPSLGGSTLLVRLVPRAPAPPERRVWAQAREAGLTPREADILDALARGRSHKQIACDLGIRYFTVTTHARNLFAKLGVSGRTEALAAVAQRAEERARR